MKLPEAKGKKKTEQSESVAQILTAMQKVRAEKKKPPVTSYAPVKEMPVDEPESMEEFSQLASAGIYSDHGISATSREGGTGFNRLLRHCKKGKIDRMICKSISRLARNTQDFLVALRTLKENNVTILFEREAMDTADAFIGFRRCNPNKTVEVLMDGWQVNGLCIRY